MNFFHYLVSALHPQFLIEVLDLSAERLGSLWTGFLDDLGGGFVVAKEEGFLMHHVSAVLLERRILQ
jgi:hypothetical protein